jgi:peptidoglycan-associated lipoprotein
MRLVRSLSVFALVLMGLSFTSCHRSGDKAWQDTKTAGRYMNRGARSMGGKQAESRQVNSAEEFAATGQQDFIPLRDEDIYRQIAMGNPDALKKINSDTAIPQSNAMPGEPGSAIPGIEGFKDPSGRLAQIFQSIHFETDDYAVRGADNFAAIREIADYLKAHPNTFAFVEGHCDKRGPAAYNLSLGLRRSNSVRNMLIKEGVDLNHLFTISYGKERPVATGEDDLAWQQNRRAQFKVFSKGE